jgi:hypothetical protein
LKAGKEFKGGVRGVSPRYPRESRARHVPKRRASAASEAHRERSEPFKAGVTFVLFPRSGATRPTDGGVQRTPPGVRWTELSVGDFNSTGGWLTRRVSWTSRAWTSTVRQGATEINSTGGGKKTTSSKRGASTITLGTTRRSYPSPLPTRSSTRASNARSRADIPVSTSSEARRPI